MKIENETWSCTRRQWQIVKEGAYEPVQEVVTELPGGSYTIRVTDNADVRFEKHPLICDGMITLPGSPAEKVLAQIEKFWNSRQRYAALDMTYKRGFLFHGAPGNGKTMLIRMMMRDLIARYNGIVTFYTHPQVLLMGLKALREVEPERPVIVVLEDVDVIIAQYSDRHISSLLDGDDQIDNVVFVATTNHIEQLEARIANRPSRFDTRILVGLPSQEARASYIEHRAAGQLSPDEIENWAAATEGLSLAHVRELVAAVLVLELDFDETVKQLRGMAVKAKDESGFAEEKKKASPVIAPPPNDDIYNPYDPDDEHENIDACLAQGSVSS